jgi:hypothetical protein
MNVILGQNGVPAGRRVSNAAGTDAQQRLQQASFTVLALEPGSSLQQVWAASIQQGAALPWQANSA